MLGEIFEINRGGSPRPIQDYLTDEADGVNWISIADAAASDKFIHTTKKRIRPEGVCRSRMVNPGDFLLTNSMSFGRPYIMSTSGCVHDGWLVLSSRQNNLDRDYFYYLLSSDATYAKFSRLAAGATVKNLNIDLVAGVEVAFPPLPEQRRIAAILDLAESLRTKRRAAIAQLDSLTQSVFLDMFCDPSENPNNWARVRLDSLVRPNDTINYGVVQPGDALDEGVPLVRVGDIVDGNLSAKSLKRIDPAIESTYKRSRLKGDEVLVTCVGSIGVVALVEPEMKGFDIARAVARVPLSDQIDRIFIASYPRSDCVQRYFSAELRTVSQPTLNIKQICETMVTLPPLARQQIFASRAKAIDVLKAKHRAALCELDALFASLQHRAFNGELATKATIAKPKSSHLAELGQLDASKGLEALVYAARRLPSKGHYWPLKVQYLADRRHLERYGRTVYGETHMAMPYGPVPQAAFNASRALDKGELICEFPMDAVRAALRRDGDVLIALRDADTGVLGADERESLDWAIRYVADMSFDQIKAASHDTAWDKTPANTPMAWQDIIESLAPAVRQRLLRQFE